MSQMEIPKGWELKTIEEICTKITDGEHLKPEVAFDGIPFVSAKDLKEKGVDFSHVLYVKKSDAMVFRKKCDPEKNDILIGSRGSIGRICIVNTDQIFCLLGSVILLKILPSIQSKFISYFLKSSQTQNQLLNASGHSVVKAIYLKDIKKLQIPVAPIEIQKKIIKKLDYVLEQLEGKKQEILSLIEQNKKRIDFFEKNWFSYAIDQEIEKHPQRKQWELKRLDSLATVGQGGTPSRSMPQYWSGDIPWLSSGELRNNKIIDSREKITTLGLKNSSTQLCPKGTIMIAMTGQGLTRGRTALLEIDSCANQSCAHMIVNDQQLIPEYLWLYLQSQYWNIRSIHHGSGQPGINTTMIRSWEIPLPPIPIQKVIIKKIINANKKFKQQKTQFENIKENYGSQIKYINRIQSSILDSAFSGKLVN
jgi:restriction endonuclease S subunit